MQSSHPDEDKSMEKLFLTGGSGFIGINVMECFLEAGIQVYNYDCCNISDMVEDYFSRLPGSYHFIQGDILEREKLSASLYQSGADTVIHMAVITVTEERERSDTRHIFDVNCGGTLNMLDASVKAGIRKFIYVSSIAAYGTTAFEADILKEDMDNLKPENLYQISKFASEKLSLRYKYLYDMDVLCARLGDVFGPWERPTKFRDKMSAPCITLQYAMEGRNAVLKRPNRTSWVYSRDIADSLYLLAEASCGFDIYNLSSCHIWSIADWCKALTRHFPGFKWRIAKEGEMSNVFYHGAEDNAPMSVERLCRAGHTPRYDMEKAMEDYIAWAGEYPVFFGKVK